MSTARPPVATVLSGGFDPASQSLPSFQVAGGSIRGHHHEHRGSNNQDALAWSVTDTMLLAVVCDGCGSGPYSDVGARLGARLLLEALRQWSTALPQAPVATVLEHVRRSMLRRLRGIVQAMGGDMVRLVQEYFLFTIVGVLITRQQAAVFTLGDGVMAVNQAYTPLVYPENAPPYLAYGLIPAQVGRALQPHLRFRLHWSGQADEIQHLLIGSDGVDDLVQAAGQRRPGSPAPVGPLAQFWREERYFRNPYGITRHLALVNRSVTQYEWEQHRVQTTPGLLPDDTTLVVIRRTPGTAQEGS